MSHNDAVSLVFSRADLSKTVKVAIKRRQGGVKGLIRCGSEGKKFRCPFFGNTTNRDAVSPPLCQLPKNFVSSRQITARNWPTLRENKVRPRRKKREQKFILVISWRSVN